MKRIRQSRIVHMPNRMIRTVLLLLVVSAGSLVIWNLVPANDNRVLYEGRITLVADQTWSPQECRELRALYQQVYPAVVSLYGEPNAQRTITVSKQTGIVSDNQLEGRLDQEGYVVFSVSNTIRLSDGVLMYPGLAIHELVHAFHGVAIPALLRQDPKRDAAHIWFHDACEEGMTQAVADMVADQLHLATDKNHFVTIPAAFNAPWLRYVRRMDANEALYPLRMMVAAQAMRFWEENHRGFFHQLNRDLYNRQTQGRGLTIAADVLPAAERITRGFAAWYCQQNVFNPDPIPGDTIVLLGDKTQVLTCLLRVEPNGNERILDETIALTITDSTDHRVKLVSSPSISSLAPPQIHYIAQASWRDHTESFQL